MKHLLLFVLGLILLSGCDRVEDTPAPDRFSTFEARALQFRNLPAGSVFTFNLLDSLPFRAEYRLEMGTPVFGSLTIQPGVAGTFTYTPPTGFSGKDSVSYQVCQGPVCKPPTWLRFFVTPPPPPPCRFGFRDDTVVLLPNFNFVLLSLESFGQNDSLCAETWNNASFRVVPIPPNNAVYELKFQHNRWWFLVKQPQNFTSGTFQYTACTNSGQCDTATVVIQKQP